MKNYVCIDAEGVIGMEDNLKKIFGTYEIPDEIVKLYELEKELNDIDLSLDRIGFQPCSPDFTYSITPPDLIPFASTGGGGIHFGFLTDFGTVPTLAEAPIVCVSPTNDPPIRYMASNITEFFNLVSSVPHAEMLENFWANSDETSIQEEMKMIAEDTPAEWKSAQDKVAEHFKNKFDTQQVKFVAALQEAKEKRMNTIILSTMDGLGVVGEDRDSTYVKFEFDRNNSDDQLGRINDYLKNSSTVEKLAFIRDANYSFILVPDYDKEILQLVIELLESMNLHDEAYRMKIRD